MPDPKSPFRHLFDKQIVLPSDHGSWVFLLSPLLIGAFAAGNWTPEFILLFIGLLAVFFLRQPASQAVKALSKRRSRKIIPVALFWAALYGGIGLAAFLFLSNQGFKYLWWLALPGLLVFTWHLWLVSQRAERNQLGVDLIASGVLALSAPAAYWVGVNSSSRIGWALWVLTWLQSAASIIYAFLRLQQRRLETTPSMSFRWQIGKRALLYAGFNLCVGLAAPFIMDLSKWLWVPYLIQFAEVVWGTLHPAVGKKPAQIGLRQLLVSALFTLTFILIWQFG